MADTPTIQIDQIADAITAVPGVLVESDTINFPSVDDTGSSNIFSRIDDGGSGDANFTVHVPVAGKYKVTLHTSWLPINTNTGEIDFRLNIDSGDQYVGAANSGTTTKATPDDGTWRCRLEGNTYRKWTAFVAEVELTAGDHTIEVEWARHSGTGDGRVNQYDWMKVSLESLSGSGAGGNIVTKEVLTADKALNDTEQDILSATFQTVEGENVVVSFLGSVSKPTSGAASCYCWLYLDGSKHHYWISRADAQYATRNLSITVPLLNLSAGSHTVKVTIELYSTETATLIADAGGEEDVACMLSVLQHRGGLVPIRQDGVDKVGTPRALDFIGAGVYQVEEGTGDDAGVAKIQLNQAITAIGDIQEFAGDITTQVDLDTTDTYKQITPEGSGSYTFVPKSTGLYRVDLQFMAFTTYSANENFLFKVEFDDGVNPVIVVGDSESWGYRLNALQEYANYPFIGVASLVAGTTYAVRAYGKRVGSTSSEMNIPIIGRRPQITVQAITGSGAGGTLVQTDEQFSVSLPTGVNTEVHSLDVTTSENDDVLVIFNGYAKHSTTTDPVPIVTIDVDGTHVLAVTRHKNIAGNNTARDNLSFSRVVPASLLGSGTHTIKVKIQSNAAGCTTEDYSYMQAMLIRGGLVPIRQDGETIVDKPAAIDFVGPNVQVTNNGGTASVNFNGVANGLDVTEAELSADFSTSSVTFVDVDNGGGDKLSVDVDVVQNEKIMVLLEGYCLRTSGGNRVDVNYVIDGVSIPVTGLIGETQGSTGWATSLGSYGPVISLAQNAGTITVKVQTKVSSNGVDWKQGAKLKVIRFKGGYVQAENLPILEYNSGDLDVVNVVQGPGSDDELRITLNSGRRVKVGTSLSVDLDVSGEGGLDTGSQAASTWYHIYAVESSTTGVAAVVGSTTDPDAGGPTGYDEWRWLGAIYNNSSSNIRQFWQVGAQFFQKPDESDLLLFDGVATKNSWQNLTANLAVAIPVVVADEVTVRAFHDGDGGQTNVVYVEPGNPPGWTPSAASDQGKAVALLTSQDNMQHNASRRINLFDGTLSYYALQPVGSGDINLAIIATAWSSSRLRDQAVIRERYYEVIQAETTNKTLTPDDSRKTFTNEGAAGQVDFTLPSAAEGLQFTFCIVANQILKIITDSTGDDIRIAASITAGASRYIQANTVGNTVEIRAISASLWMAISSHGTWTFST